MTLRRAVRTLILFQGCIISCVESTPSLPSLKLPMIKRRHHFLGPKRASPQRTPPPPVLPPPPQLSLFASQLKRIDNAMRLACRQALDSTLAILQMPKGLLVATVLRQLRCILTWRFPFGIVAMGTVWQQTRRKSLWDELGLLNLIQPKESDQRVVGGISLDAVDGALTTTTGGRGGNGSPFPRMRFLLAHDARSIAAVAKEGVALSKERIPHQTPSASTSDDDDDAVLLLVVKAHHLQSNLSASLQLTCGGVRHRLKHVNALGAALDTFASQSQLEEEVDDDGRRRRRRRRRSGIVEAKATSMSTSSKQCSSNNKRETQLLVRRSALLLEASLVESLLRVVRDALLHSLAAAHTDRGGGGGGSFHHSWIVVHRKQSRIMRLLEATSSWVSRAVAGTPAAAAAAAATSTSTEEEAAASAHLSLATAERECVLAHVSSLEHQRLGRMERLLLALPNDVAGDGGGGSCGGDGGEVRRGGDPVINALMAKNGLPSGGGRSGDGGGEDSEYDDDLSMRALQVWERDTRDWVDHAWMELGNALGVGTEAAADAAAAAAAANAANAANAAGSGESEGRGEREAASGSSKEVCEGQQQRYHHRVDGVAAGASSSGRMGRSVVEIAESMTAAQTPALELVAFADPTSGPSFLVSSSSSSSFVASSPSSSSPSPSSSASPSLLAHFLPWHVSSSPISKHGKKKECDDKPLFSSASLQWKHMLDAALALPTARARLLMALRLSTSITSSKRAPTKPSSRPPLPSLPSQALSSPSSPSPLSSVLDQPVLVRSSDSSRIRSSDSSSSSSSRSSSSSFLLDNTTEVLSKKWRTCPVVQRRRRRLSSGGDGNYFTVGAETCPNPQQQRTQTQQRQRQQQQLTPQRLAMMVSAVSLSFPTKQALRLGISWVVHRLLKAGKLVLEEEEEEEEAGEVGNGLGRGELGSSSSDGGGRGIGERGPMPLISWLVRGQLQRRRRHRHKAEAALQTRTTAVATPLTTTTTRSSSNNNKRCYHRRRRRRHGAGVAARNLLRCSAKKLGQSWHDGSSLSAGILQRRFVVPLKGVLDDAFNRVPRLVEKGAVADAEGSLANMLEDFLEENDSRKKGGKSSKTTKEERRKLAETLNPALISTAYEEELKKNVVKNFLNGKTARLVLIQAQFLKKEVLKAMSALDDMVDANRLNVQLLATLPSLWLASALAKLSMNLLYSVRTRKLHSKGRKQSLIKAARLVEEMERLVLLNGRTVTMPTMPTMATTTAAARGVYGSSALLGGRDAGQGGGGGACDGAGDVHSEFLTDEALGALCVLLHRHALAMSEADVNVVYTSGRSGIGIGGGGSDRGVAGIERGWSKRELIEDDLRCVFFPGELTRAQQAVLLSRVAEKHRRL